MRNLEQILLAFFLCQMSVFGQDYLITADELSGKLQEVVVLDIRPVEKFEAGHIFQAKNIWRPQYENQDYAYGGMMPTERQFCARMTELNIGIDDQIVVYDDKGGCEATRIWWIFDQLSRGHKHPLILDGGWKSWGNRNSTISPWLADTVQRQQFVFPFQDENKSCTGLATLAEVKLAIYDTNTLLVDTRSWDEFFGSVQKDGAYASGRIPGAIHYDWINSINYEGDKKLKNREDLLAVFENKGINKEMDIICYCHSGVRSSHTTFVLSQVLGYPNVKNYDGSWIEYSYFAQEEDLQIATGDPLESDDRRETGGKASYAEIFLSSFGEFWNYTWNEITFQVSPWYINYFWWLVVLSLGVWILEIAFPWRKDQSVIRKDFWLDAFYMFFNFYIFKIIIFMAFSNVTQQLFTDMVGGDLSDLVIYDTTQLGPVWQLIIFFIALDFIQWFTHILLHRFNFLWRFHKVHHSVEQMGFAAHLRYHWMENVFYTPMKFIVMMVIGNFGPEQAFIVYYVSIAIGHLNHANLNWSYGPLKYVFNNPKMHIWHHSHALPEDRRHGVNFGISLSCWDYIFRTNYIPSDGRDIKLGFPGLPKFPKGFFGQLIYGFRGKKDDSED